jgi:hypothetical protein
VTEGETSPTGHRSGIEQASKNVPPPAPPVQEQQSASLIDETLSTVAVAISESSTVTQASPPSLHQLAAKLINVKEKQTVSLIAEALLLVEGVSTGDPNLLKRSRGLPSRMSTPLATKHKSLACSKKRQVEWSNKHSLPGILFARIAPHPACALSRSAMRCAARSRWR